MTKPNAIEDNLIRLIATAMAASRRRVVPGGPPPTSAPMAQIQIDGYHRAAQAVLEAFEREGLCVTKKPKP